MDYINAQQYMGKEGLAGSCWVLSLRFARGSDSFSSHGPWSSSASPLPGRACALSPGAAPALRVIDPTLPRDSDSPRTHLGFGGSKEGALGEGIPGWYFPAVFQFALERRSWRWNLCVCQNLGTTSAGKNLHKTQRLTRGFVPKLICPRQPQTVILCYF